MVSTLTIDDQIESILKRVEILEADSPDNNLTLGVIKGDLDYVMAAFIVAIGAAAYDMQVDMFFTFWATAALRDPEKKVKKDFLGRMFGGMLPKGTKELPLSKMQMAGFGPKMIRSIMKKNGAKSLEELMEDAASLGIRINVCSMSMELMGIKKEELIEYPHLKHVGVGSFVNMFLNSKQCWFM
ncbi:DsrE/DsrF/DrsH-like family protein [bacterium]|nr:DsrE/DsrF/DrsH-like family protein [bacterium]